MERNYPWGEPRDDDFDEEFELGIDGCHHGLGFDEDCEDCNQEERIDNIEQRRLRRMQQSLDFPPQSDGGATK